ncbi:MAG: hypothetical protein H6608_05885 [Flavobacteriales bacterium]|nr:hypothetical protein [Flavobacteriales bacterium]
MESKFTNFIQPLIQVIDKGTFFKEPLVALFIVLGYANLIIPLYVLYLSADYGVFDASFQLVLVYLIIWLIIAFTAWVGFQIWYIRRKDVRSIFRNGDDFKAIPLISLIIQTVGEWLGAFIGIAGFGCSLVLTILASNNSRIITESIGLPLVDTGIFPIIVAPVSGFLIILFSRFISEQFRVLTFIANNTRMTSEGNSI